MAATATPERLACLIAARNLGDILIWSGLLRILSAAGYAERYLVWTRPQAAWMFEGVEDCEVVCSPFPVGTGRKFRRGDLRALIRAAGRIRARRPSVTLDFVGDLRERIFAWMAASPRHLHIGWERGHPYTRLIRNPFGAGHPLVVVPRSIPNVYAACDVMIRALLDDAGAGPAGTGASVAHRRPASGTAQFRVGLHPFASQECKKWPAANWSRVAGELLARNIDVIAFSAEEEGPELRRIFAGPGDRMTLCSGDLNEFAATVATLDVMVGLDSFSIHMAHRQNVASVMINAGAPPGLWTPPDGRLLAESGGCVHYPCYNVAPCRSTGYENACVKAIAPEQVLATIDALRTTREACGSTRHA